MYFSVSTTGVSGDISGWVLPATLVTFSVSTTGVSGDISGWVLPATLVTFYVNSTSVSGDISGWVLPATLVYFSVSTTGVSGDISGWVLPATLVTFYVSTTGVSGDISGWVLPATLRYFYVSTTSVSYKSPGGAFTNVTNTLTKIDFDACALSSQQVDNVLADLVASGSIGNELDLAGTGATANKPPTIEGLKNKIILVNRGWTVVITAGRSVYASRPMFSRKRPELWAAATAAEEEQWLTTMASDVCVTIG